jgi:TetR/AcrR family fatty acid metabolism transcriptional regulator
MARPMKTQKEGPKPQETAHPPGRVKIVNALVSLLEQKEFSAVTTAEIARTAGVTEALIYKYFKDKRDLLHQVLAAYLEEYLVQFKRDIKGVKGALNKLRKVIWGHINVYATSRVFAKILLLEVRNYPDYYTSETYGLIKEYTDILLEIIQEGVRTREIRNDIPPKLIRQVILGSMEQVCLTDVVFGRDISPDDLSEELWALIFNGIQRKAR